MHMPRQILEKGHATVIALGRTASLFTLLRFLATGFVSTNQEGYKARGSHVFTYV